MDRGGRGVMKTRHALGRRTTMHREVTGIIINHVWAEHSVVAEARWIVGDVVRLPALLFDSSSSSREVTSDSRQVGQTLSQTSFSLPV